jgi:hypothetical protein
VTSRNRVIPVIPVSASANQFTPSPFTTGAPKEGPQSFLVALTIPAGLTSVSSSINFSQFGLSQVQSAMVRNNGSTVVTIKFGVTSIPFVIAPGDTTLFPVYVAGNTVFIQAAIGTAANSDIPLDVHFFNTIQPPHIWPNVPIITKFDLTPNVNTFSTSAGPLGETQVLSGSGYGLDVMPNADSWVLEFWYSTLDATANKQCLMYIGNPSGVGSSYFAVFKDGVNSGHAQLVVNGISKFNLVITIVNDGTWHHVACAFNHAGGFVIYIDGAGAATSTFSITMSSSISLYLGVYNDLTTLDFNGFISEVSLWNYLKYTTGFVPPAFIYSGGEPGLRNLYHLNGDMYDYGPGVSS